jgi:hypothetical protein
MNEKTLLKKARSLVFLLVKKLGLSGTGGVLYGRTCAEQIGVAIGYQRVSTLK